MQTNTKTNSKDKVYTALMLDTIIRKQMEEHCRKHGLSLSQFIRNSVVNELNKPTTVKFDGVPEIDTSTIDRALEALNNKVSTIEKSLEYIIERDSTAQGKENAKVIEAKETLLERKPKTYDEANKIIEDINTMTEALLQLNEEKKVNRRGGHLKWK